MPECLENTGFFESSISLPLDGRDRLIGHVPKDAVDAGNLGDDAVAETDQSITGYTLDLSTTYLEEGVESAILGLSVDGGEFTITDDDPPYGGCGYIRVLKRNGTRMYKAVWYPKIQFSQPNESSNTKQKSINWGTPTLNGKGLAYYDGTTGKARFRQQKVFTTLAAAKAYLNGKANIS